MALLSTKFNSILFIRIATIALIYAGVLNINAFYIQSIGSGIGIFSSQFHVTTVFGRLTLASFLSYLLKKILLVAEGELLLTYF